MGLSLLHAGPAHAQAPRQPREAHGPAPTQSRKRAMPGADAAIDGPSRRPRLDDAGEAAPMAPRGLPKARARALDPRLGPSFDRQLAAQLHPGLASYLEELESAYRENRTPAVADREHLKLIIAGLNKADRALRLEFDDVAQFEPAECVKEYKLTERLQQGLGRGDAWRMVIDDMDAEHRYALSVQCSSSSPDASLILVDSLIEGEALQRWDDILGRIGQVLRQQLPADPPVRLHLGVVDAGIQRTDEGCDIFALSAARKMAAEPGIAALHDAALRALDGQPAGEQLAALSAADLPPTFFKHSTSGNDLVDHLFRRDEAGSDPVFNPVVNREGQTLLERWTSHMTTRWDPDDGKQRWYSNSYEAKRIELIRTALSALVPQPASLLSEPLGRLSAVDSRAAKRA